MTTTETVTTDRRAKKLAYQRAYRKTAKGLYVQQKTNAKKRGIPFLLTFEQWLAIWGDKLPLRGRGRGKLVMARIGDRGPYAPGNVKIIPASANVAEGTRGERSRRTSLKEADVRAIREKFASGATAPSVAADYGITAKGAYKIKYGERWGHVA